MRVRTLQQLIADVRSRADQQDASSQQFVSDSEITEWLNQAWTLVYDELIKSGDHYYLSNDVQTTTGGVDTYALPADFYQLRGLDYQAGGRYFNAHAFNWERRNDWTLFAGIWVWPMQLNYALTGNNLLLRPPPPGGLGIKIWYYPVAERMVNPTDTIDGVNGFEVFAVALAAKKCADKESNSELAAACEMEMAQQLAHIRTMATRRDATSAPVVRRVRGRIGGPGSRSSRWGSGGWGW